MRQSLSFKLHIVLALMLALYSCSSRDVVKGKLQKEIIVDDITRDGLTTVEETVSAGPSSQYNNDLKKPRRELHSKCVIPEPVPVVEEEVEVIEVEKKITKPNFDISVKFKNTEITEALHAFGNMGGRNIIVDSSVQGVLNIDINNEPWNDVFHSILDSYGLDYTGGEEEGIIQIFVKTEEIITEPVIEEEVIEEEEVVVEVIEPITEIFNIYYEKPSDVAAQINNLFSTPEGVSAEPIIFNVNDDNKTIIAKGPPCDIDQVEVLLDKLDIKKPQILIEAFLVEVKPTFESKLGSRIGISPGPDDTNPISGTVGAGGEVSFGSADQAAVASATNFLIDGNSGLGIIRQVGTGKLKVEIDALEAEGDSKTLSNPKLFTISGKNAKITQGTKFGVTTTTSIDGITTSETTYFDANLKLDVTPMITGDGNVMMDIIITNDSVSFSTNPPTITKKEVDTNLFLSSGDIAVIGGILTETLSESTGGVPGLKDVPGVGALFRSNTQKDERTELLIFLAPRVI